MNFIWKVVGKDVDEGSELKWYTQKSLKYLWLILFKLFKNFWCFCNRNDDLHVYVVGVVSMWVNLTKISHSYQTAMCGL